MLARAEAAVNYEWVPTQDIAVWNENPYNGKMYFPAGETVKGVPYTLFFSEIGVDSLLSLEEFKDKVDINYSTTAYCNSVGAMRTGPVYGSCCATFVSEVFGGSFVNGNSPRYDSVYKIINSGHCETYYNVKASDIEPGDALSNISGSHIIWVGEVTDTYITIYESTPPVARKATLYFDTNVFADGYLHYGDSSNEKSTKTTYQIGDTLDTSGLKLKLTYSDSTTESVTTGFTTSGFSSATAGTKTVTVSYGGKTTSFTVTVEEATVTGAKYEITDVTGVAGSTVEVYVSVANNPGIISLRNTITYDTSTLELIAVQDCGLLAGYTTPSATITSPYTLRVGQILWQQRTILKTDN